MLNTIGKEKGGNDIDFSILCEGRIEYLEREETISRLRNNGDESYKNVKWNTFEGKVFGTLVEIFGEDRMIELNSSNVQELATNFEKYGVSIKEFLEDLEYVKSGSLSDEKRYNDAKK